MIFLLNLSSKLIYDSYDKSWLFLYMLTDTQFVSLNFKFSKENQQYRLDISHFVIVVHIYLGAENKKKSKVYTKKAYKLGK